LTNDVITLDFWEDTYNKVTLQIIKNLLKLTRYNLTLEKTEGAIKKGQSRETDNIEEEKQNTTQYVNGQNLCNQSLDSHRCLVSMCTHFGIA
jgi:hypothetical protein